MEEGNVALQERPMMDNPDEQIKLRDNLRIRHYGEEINYSKAEKEVHGDMLPKNHRELLDMLDQKVKEVQRDRKDKEENRENMPNFVLRHEDNWESIGWPEDKKRAVREKLRTVLKITNDTAVENALECIVATGRTPEQALELLTPDNYDKMLELATTIGKQATDSKDFAISEGQQELAKQTVMLNRLLGINEDYIKRFILFKEYTNHALRFMPGFERTIQDEFDNQLPANLLDLAWNIGFERKELFGVEGKYPVLQMAIKKDKNGNVNAKESRFVVNEANWMRWMRDHINWWYNEYDTDAVTDYFAKVEVKKGPFYSVNLVTMLYGFNRYFRDETGHMWTRLYDQTLLEPWMMMFQRDYALAYDEASQDEEQLANTLKDKYRLNKLTRNIYNNQSMAQILSILPVDFIGPDSDTKVGEAFQKMFHAYYNLGDFKELKRVLGKDSDFFKLDGWKNAMQEVMEGIAKEKHIPQMEGFLGERQKGFLAAFDKNGNIKKGKEQDFIDAINIFNDEPVSGTMGKVLTAALKGAVAEQLLTKEINTLSPEVNKNKLTPDGKAMDNISLDYAWLLAHSWSYFSGGRARSNFPGVSGYLAETKWLFTDAYRMKYMTFGGAGNPYTVPMFKQLTIPLFEGMLAENSNKWFVETRDHHGNPKKTASRQLTAMEVFKQMLEQSQMYEKIRKEFQDRLSKPGITEDERKAILKEQERMEDEAKNAYKIVAGQLVFKENAMRVYSKNIVGRAKTLYEQIMKSKETAFDKFTTYDGLFRGPSFHREEWQAALQDKFITPLRYLFEANRATQLNQIVRAPVYIGRDSNNKPKWEWKDQYLGERMLGHQIVDIHEFWKEVHDYAPEEWAELKKRGFRKRGHYAIRPDGKHEIDWNKVQNDKPLVYKQWLLMKIAGDLWAHIDRHSTDPLYTFEHYEDIVEAIKSLPGDIAGDEFNLKGVKVPKAFFSKHQIHWLERISGKNAVSNRAFWSDIFIGDKRKKDSAIGESVSIIMSGIFRGYGGR